MNKKIVNTFNRTKLSREELIRLVGRPFEAYKDSLNDEDPGHGLLDPVSVLEKLLEYGIPLPEGKSLLPKRDGETKSGEVWLGAYNVIYFQLGKTQDGLEVFVELGGDSLDQGTVHITDRSLHKHRASYDYVRKIFPKNHEAST